MHLLYARFDNRFSVAKFNISTKLKSLQTDIDHQSIGFA